MQFKKLALGLSLTAAFGLMACGDDSSSSPTTGSVLDNSCKVSVSGKTASYTRVSQGIFTFTQSVTVNGDGTEEWSVKETYPKNTFTKAEQEVYCETAKLEAVIDDEEDGSVLKDFKCSDGEISGTWTESTDEKITVDQYKSLFEYICNPFENEMPDFMGDDDDDEDDDDDDKKQPGSSSKEDCSFKMDSDTWSYGYYNIGLGGDMTKTYTISGNEYKILYTYKGESLDAQSTSGKFSDSYTRKDMFNEAQDHCLTVNGLKDSSDDEDDDDDYESPVGSDDDDDSEEPAIDDPDSPLESSDYTCDIPEDGDKWVISYKNEDMVTETVYTFEGKTMLTSIRVISPVSDCSMYEDAKPTDGSTYSCKDGMLTKTFVAEETEDVDKAFQYKIVKATCAG